MTGLTGLEIDLRFDPAPLTQLQVETGPVLRGTLLAVNNREPGRVRLAAVSSSPISSAGTLATLRSSVSSELTILSFSARATDSQGRPVPVATRTVAASGGKEVPSAPLPETGAASPSPAPASTLPPFTGSLPIAGRSSSLIPASTVTFPPSKADGPPATPSPASPPPPAIVDDSAAAPAEPAPAGTPPPGVELPPEEPEPRRILALEPLWQSYCRSQARGVPEGIEALLASRNEVIRQIPPVVISNGTSEAELIIPRGGGKAPNVGISGGKVVETANIGEDAWRLRVLPNRGTPEVELFLADRTLEMQISLVVTPPATESAAPAAGKEVTPGEGGEAACRERYFQRLREIAAEKPATTTEPAGSAGSAESTEGKK